EGGKHVCHSGSDGRQGHRCESRMESSPRRFRPERHGASGGALERGERIRIYRSGIRAGSDPEPLAGNRPPFLLPLMAFTGSEASHYHTYTKQADSTASRDGYKYSVFRYPPPMKPSPFCTFVITSGTARTFGSNVPPGGSQPPSPMRTCSFSVSSVTVSRKSSTR